MGRGTVNTPGKFGYDLTVLKDRVEQVAAGGLKLGTAEAAEKMLDGTFDWDKDSAAPAALQATGEKHVSA